MLLTLSSFYSDLFFVKVMVREDCPPVSKNVFVWTIRESFTLFLHLHYLRHFVECLGRSFLFFPLLSILTCLLSLLAHQLAFYSKFAKFCLLLTISLRSTFHFVFLLQNFRTHFFYKLLAEPNLRSQDSFSNCQFVLWKHCLH